MFTQKSMNMLSGDVIRLISTRYLDILSALSFRLVSKTISLAMSKAFVDDLKRKFFQRINQNFQDNNEKCYCNNNKCIKKLCNGCGVSFCKKRIFSHKQYCAGCKLTCCLVPVMFLGHKFECNYTSQRYFVEQHKKSNDHCLVCSKCSFQINMVIKSVYGQQKWRAPVGTAINICGSTLPQNVHYISYDSNKYQSLLLNKYKY